MSHRTIRFAGYSSLARFTEGGDFAMARRKVRSGQD